MIAVPNPRSPTQTEIVASPFEDPVDHPTAVDGLPTPRSQSPLPPLPPPPLDSPHHETLDKFRDEISRLSQQVESLLLQLAAQNNLRDTNDALRLENEILKTQVKDTEKMMTDVLAANDSESAGSQERYAQDITRLIGDLAEKETQCEERDRKIALLTEDEKHLRDKLRDMDGTVAKQMADVAEYQQMIESQKNEISELNGRVADMSKVLADEPEAGRSGTTSNRELRVLIRDVTRENDDLKGQVRDMQRSMEQILLSTKHARYDEMERENKKLRKQASELEMVVTQMQSSASIGLGTMKRNGKSPVGQRSLQSSRLQSSEAVTKENEQLKSQLQDGKRSFADYRSTSETKIVELQQKIDALAQENNQLKLDIREEGSQEDSSVPPPAYDESFVASP